MLLGGLKFLGNFFRTFCLPWRHQSKSDLTLKEITENNVKIKNFNGEEKYFNFFY